MTLRRLTGFTALLLIAVGIALAGWGPMIAPWFGVPASPVPDLAATGSRGWWELVAFGALLWVVRRSFASIWYVRGRDGPAHAVPPAYARRSSAGG